MKKTLWGFVSLLTALLFSSCTVESTDPDYASVITGTYKMTSYVTKSGSSTPSANDNMVIERKSDKKAIVTIDYATGEDNDVEADDVSIVKTGDDYNLTQSFTNAELKATVSGTILTYRLDYNDGSYVIISATKK